MHSPLIWIVCTSPSKLVILLKKENSRFSDVVHPIEIPLLMSPCYTWKSENQIWNSMVSFENQQYSHRTSQMRKTLYSPQWQMRYLIIVFAYTHWSKEMSPFRKSSSYSGWPIRNKQFHFLGVGNHPISTISTLSAAVSDGLWSKSPNCQELSATIQYQIRTVEQKKTPNQINWKEFLLSTS